MYSVLNELARMYEDNGRFSEAAIEHTVSGNHRSAGNCYIKMNDHLSALNSYEQIDGVKKFVTLCKSWSAAEAGRDKSMAKSPMAKSPMAKSPMAKSPMAKSPSLPVQPKPEVLSLQEKFDLKDDLITIYLLKLCISDNPQKLGVSFPILPTLFSFHGSGGNPSNASITYRSDEVEAINIGLESLLQLVKERRFKKDMVFKCSILKELNPRFNELQRMLLHYILNA